MDPIVIFFAGCQGSGKTTQGKMLAEIGFCFADASDVLRDRGKHDPAYEHEVNACQSAGVLVPDEITIGVFKDYLQKNTDPGDNLALVGFIRTKDQALEMISYYQVLGYTVVVCLLHLDGETSATRAGDRKRPDDKPDILRLRMNAFYTNLGPVLATAVGLGCSIYTINASSSPDEVHRAICEAARIKTGVDTVLHAGFVG